MLFGKTHANLARADVAALLEANGDFLRDLSRHKWHFECFARNSRPPSSASSLRKKSLATFWRRRRRRWRRRCNQALHLALDTRLSLSEGEAVNLSRRVSEGLRPKSAGTRPPLRAALTTSFVIADEF